MRWPGELPYRASLLYRVRIHSLERPRSTYAEPLTQQVVSVADRMIFERAENCIAEFFVERPRLEAGGIQVSAGASAFDRVLLGDG